MDKKKLNKKSVNSSKDELVELLNDESFIRWIRGNASISEESHWLEWLSKNPENQEVYNLAKQILSIPIRKEKIPETEYELQKLRYSIAREKLNEGNILVEFISNINRHRFALIVSIILIALIIGFYEINKINQPKVPESFITVSTNYVEKDTIKFDDGSFVILNANSSLKYNPNVNIKKNKELTVWFDGEGYFSITHNPNGHKRIFNIVTEEGKIQVLGTKFNVESRNRITEVVLQEGKLKVLLNDTINQTSKYYIMKPGELTTLDYEKKSIKVEKVDPTFYISWINDKMIFNRTPLTTIVKKIENTYGVKIEVKNDEFLNKKLSGVINNYDLETLIKGLSKTLDATIRYKEGKIIISKK